ncbi:rhodanese-like domain-containing protein [Candidatus Endowatersipora endosymbiont of Watersipora subatra]|uniref:rhodanese-like domain-containing protein n=1 Tax=Candidatus Endowatersipora endosymbiont of Watersipora subatra TaxID=3077946 RepID=UPI00312CAF56
MLISSQLEVTPSFCFKELMSHDQAILVDVRTRAEWSFVGIPDIQTTQKKLILQQWQTYPDMSVNHQFAETLLAELKNIGLKKHDPHLFFLCRSGVRSLAAARLMKTKGYLNTFNVKDGFEGPLDENGQRGQVKGWKAEGLPWRQDRMDTV